jgi:hypothetical protein
VTLPVNGTEFVLSPEHFTCDGLHVTITVGWTVIVNILCSPEQLLAMGSTSYATIPSEEPVFCKISAMVVPQFELQSVMGCTFPSCGS